MEKATLSKYALAKNRVSRIKRFYYHVVSYVIFNFLLLCVRGEIVSFFQNNGVSDPTFFEWLYWNIIATPLLWGLALFMHGLYVFQFKGDISGHIKPRFLKRWEERQLHKYYEENHRVF